MTDQTANNPARQPSTSQSLVKPSRSVVAVAVALLLGSLVILSVSFWVLNSMIQHSYDWNQFVLSISTFVNAVFFGLTLIQTVFSLMGIIVSIGLLQSRGWARKAAILLSTLPVAMLAFALLIFWGATSETGRGGIVAAYYLLLYGAFFLLLLPLSIWWFVVLSRDTVKSQFREE
jgi:magnesium-transporting ATPase (P-type)